MDRRAARTVKGFVLTALGIALVTCLLFLMVEGVSSVVMVGRALLTQSKRPIAERAHTRYDPTLGWVSIPNLYIQDMYGPGVHLQTNSQGFRDSHDFPKAIPQGKTRIICSGDSFTLSYGVNNDEAWCQLLATQDRGLETVNMGQGGYGVDQAYLWYMRDGREVDHNIQLLSFIADDFERAGRTDFLGYGKPLLKVVSGRIEATNVPVPRRSYLFPWLTQNAGILSGLKSVQLIRTIRRPAGDASTPDTQSASREATQSVAAKIFETLKEENRSRQSQLVLVFLPMNAGDDGGAWRAFVHAEAARQGIPLIDTVDDVRRLTGREARALFADHFSVGGNQFFAEHIYAHLAALPNSPLRPVSATPQEAAPQ